MGAPVAVAFDAAWVDRQLALRNWTVRDLMRYARIGKHAAANLHAGRHVGQDTLVKVAAAFTMNPIDRRYAAIAEGLK
jgi:hypothetical protein